MQTAVVEKDRKTQKKKKMITRVCSVARFGLKSRAVTPLKKTIVKTLQLKCKNRYRILEKSWIRSRLCTEERAIEVGEGDWARGRSDSGNMSSLPPPHPNPFFGNG